MCVKACVVGNERKGENGGEMLPLIWDNKTFLSCTSVHQLTVVFPLSLSLLCVSVCVCQLAEDEHVYLKGSEPARVCCLAIPDWQHHRIWTRVCLPLFSQCSLQGEIGYRDAHTYTHVHVSNLHLADRISENCKSHIGGFSETLLDSSVVTERWPEFPWWQEGVRKQV